MFDSTEPTVARRSPGERVRARLESRVRRRRPRRARPRSRRNGRLRTWMAIVVSAVIAGIAMATLWIAMHRVPWLGARLADTARAVVGTEAIAQAEVLAYGLDDRFNRFTRKGEAPVAHWSVPDSPTAPRREDTNLG